MSPRPNSLHQPIDLLAENGAFKRHLTTFEGLEDAIDDYQYALSEIEASGATGVPVLDGVMNGLLIANELDASIGLLKSITKRDVVTPIDSPPSYAVFNDMRLNGTCIARESMQGLLLSHMMSDLMYADALTRGDLAKAITGLAHFRELFKERISAGHLRDENIYLDATAARFVTHFLVPRIGELEIKLDAQLGELEQMSKSQPSHTQRVKRRPTLSEDELNEAIRKGEESGVVRRIDFTPKRGDGKPPAR